MHLCFRAAPVPKRPTTYQAKLKYRGVNWVASDSVTLNHLAAAKKCNIQWIAQTPFGWQRNYNTPEIQLNTRPNKHYWGESDAGLIHTTLLARQAGIKTLLKPHIWLMNREQNKWIGDIAMISEADWQAWFKNYAAFILHYARLAETHHIEALCIGTELMNPAVSREKDWRQLIKEIRQVYHGELTYAANWYLEYEKIKFWDALDFIGVQGYFPLSQKNNPDLAELQAGWKSHVPRLEKIAKKYRKPIVFTEVGYKSSPDAAVEPWKWPERGDNTAFMESYETQANCYEALFKTLWHQPWFGGIFIWKWYPQVRDNGRDHRDFTPQHKPAEKILAEWYGK
ncbi:hypothetical protein HUW51_16795 [Adhaeribacter swui]|uniref:GTA TIM-barrel-like domain-containing protein n=1 Tax=Adhaeribacter swui TaxID=2086471 RepID=A0A7G7GFD5_9BACT|nr:hypothetical protein HUW51_16795 [Adhaeribacter swui]